MTHPTPFSAINNDPPSPLPAYKNPALPAEQRVQDLLARMTPEEKATLLSGSGWMESAAIQRLGIPAIKMVDGPVGVRAWTGSSAETNRPDADAVKILSTAFPVGIALAATWNTALAERQGQAIARQVKTLGRNMLLAPTVNISRLPLWGRNFEGYGEDPYLAGRMGVGYIRGVQGEGVIASVKHLAVNNQEFQRRRVNVTVDVRALHEIYLPAFKAAVQEAGVWSVMSAYNKVNGAHASENKPLLHDILRRQWGFRGFVISDWGSTYSTLAPLNAGLDLEMPGGAARQRFLDSPRAEAEYARGGWLTAERVLAEIKAGRLSQDQVDDHAGNILRAIFLSGLFDHQPAGGGELDTPVQQALARQIATESMVLLKNERGILPLDPDRIKTIAVIGPNAGVARTGGGGSSLVKPKTAIAPFDAIRQRAGAGVNVRYALGVSMAGEDPREDNTLARARQLKNATDLAANADVAIVVVGRYPKLEGEGFDISAMDLPPGQDTLIQAVAGVNPNTIVVLNTGSPVTVSRWLPDISGLVNMWYGGQAGGEALASILFGDANPSGKLPLTFPVSWEDSPAYGNYPGENLQVNYAEGIYVGYRYFDKNNLQPQFPFGFGLSYTTFEYSELAVATVNKGKQIANVTLQVRNTGSRAGAEVVQLYVHDSHSRIERPLRELKGFSRVELQPGEAKTVSFRLELSALAYYSTEQADWVAEPGQFILQIGSSSRDIRLEAALELKSS
ncbi:glycoside hydrolase family 3 C-terminal domain-containing protein [Brenneria goodwinii]|uniref:glycoside hydrolase family 3 C-terminal domain-containing protein n=1 Tax=Brenneria goodwinii TaxID=1109412 RepID=UPI0036E508C2